MVAKKHMIYHVINIFVHNLISNQNSNPTFSAKIKPSVRAAFSFEGGIRKAALGNVPVARCSRRGFSAEKRIHPTAPRFYLSDKMCPHAFHFR